MDGKLLNEFYFVALGKKRGGYYDLLGLPVSVGVTEATKKEKAYRDDLLFKQKSEKREIKARYDDKEITMQEFDNFNKEQDLKYNADLARLEKLKKEFRAKMADKRKPGKSVDPGWYPMYRVISETSDLNELVFQNRSLKQQNPNSGANSSGGLFKKSRHLIDKRHYHLLQQNDLCVEGSRFFLTISSWHMILKSLAENYAKLYGGFLSLTDLAETRERIGIRENKTVVPVLFPALNQSYKLQLDQLQEQEMEDYSKTPERKGDVSAFDELLRKELLKLLLMGKFPI